MTAPKEVTRSTIEAGATSICRFGSRKSETNNSSPPAGFSESEAKANRRIDRVAIEVAVRQFAIDPIRKSVMPLLRFDVSEGRSEI
jgi:hypothetical protein